MKLNLTLDQVRRVEGIIKIVCWLNDGDPSPDAVRIRRHDLALLELIQSQRRMQRKVQHDL